MADFNPQAVLYNTPGTLMIAAEDADEPTSETDAWPDGWYNLGYTDTGSTFTSAPQSGAVSVAEEVEQFDTVITGRASSIAFALAELTRRNLSIVYNGGLLVGDGTSWSFEPPQLGQEVRVKLGWDAIGIDGNVADNFLRLICRRCLQTGSSTVAFNKGTAVASLSATFSLSKPLDGSKHYEWFGDGAHNPAP